MSRYFGCGLPAPRGTRVLQLLASDSTFAILSNSLRRDTEQTNFLPHVGRMGGRPLTFSLRPGLGQGGFRKCPGDTPTKNMLLENFGCLSIGFHLRRTGKTMTISSDRACGRRNMSCACFGSLHPSISRTGGPSASGPRCMREQMVQPTTAQMGDKF